MGRLGEPDVSCVAINGDGNSAAAGGYQYIPTASVSKYTRAWLRVWDLEEDSDAPLDVINLPDGPWPHSTVHFIRWSLGYCNIWT